MPSKIIPGFCLPALSKRQASVQGYNVVSIRHAYSTEAGQVCNCFIWSWRLHAGVTGLRTSNELRVEGLIEKLHSITDKAVAVGFGVSGPEQVPLSALSTAIHVRTLPLSHAAMFLHDALPVIALKLVSSLYLRYVKPLGVHGYCYLLLSGLPLQSK